MLIRILLSFLPAQAILCSELDIGTDLTTMGNIISEGVVQPGWSYHDAKQKYSPAQSEVYFYLKGLDLLGPTFEVLEFHHDDEKSYGYNKWLFMNVSIDEKIDGLFKDYTVYKVVQQCEDRDGGATIRLNITFKAFSCDPVTINWLKICGEPSATQDSLNIGLSKSTSEVVASGVVTQSFDGNIKKSIFTLPTTDASIKFFMYSADSNKKIYYQEPYIITDHAVMYPALTGSMAKGGWVGSQILELNIEFNCIVDDGIQEEVILVVELPYFHDLEIHFFKVCGEVSVSYVKISTVIFVLVAVLVSGFIFYKCSEYKTGDAEEYKEKLQGWASGLKAKVLGLVHRQDNSSENFEETKADGDNKLGFNVHTHYGTL